MKITFRVAGLSGLSDNNTVKSYYRQIFAKSFPGKVYLGNRSNGCKLILIC